MEAAALRASAQAIEAPRAGTPRYTGRSEMAKTTPEIREAATKIRSSVIDAVFEKCWTEFIRNSDELAVNKIADCRRGHENQHVSRCYIRAHWLGRYLPTRQFFLSI